MSREWKIGDKVLCVKATPALTEGREYIIEGFACCPYCGAETLHLAGLDSLRKNDCSACGAMCFCIGRPQFLKRRFIKPDLSSLTNYHSQVTVKEISVPQELKELTELQSH